MGSSVSFAKKNIKDIFKLSPAQEGMLAYYLQFPNSSVFFERLCVTLRGEIDRNRFAQAWNFVVEGNDALRTVFRWEQIQTPVQVVLRRHQPCLLFNESLEGVMDLGDVPFVVELHALEGDRYEMVLNYHHIILDGWSSGIVLREFFRVYDALSEEKHVAPLEKTSFKNYVSFLQKQDKTYLESFWKEYLNFGQTTSQIPVRSGNMSNLGHYSFGLGSQLSGKINDYNRERKTSLSSLLYAAWGLLLSRYLDSGDIVFDTTVSGRSVNIDGVEEMTGLLINTLPVYFQLDGDRAPEDLVRELQDHLNRRQEFETTSRSIIQKFLRQPAAMPPFTSVLAVENYPVDESLRSPERRLWIEHVHILEQTLHDLTVIVETGPELTISVSYNEKLFDRKSIALLFEHFQTILTNILEPATDRAADLLPVESEALSEAAESLRRQIAASTQQTGPAYVAPGNDTEHQLAEVWAAILNIDVSVVGIDHDFFAYGGHSLKASALAMRLTEEFDAKIPLSWVFQHPTIRRQYEALIAMDRDTGELPAIVAGDVREHYPVASAQERLYFLWQLDRDSVAYNSPVFMTLQGELDAERLQQAVTRLVEHHEVLRTTFVLVEGRPYQKIHASVDCPLERLPKTDLESVKRAFVKPFDLDRGPLVRMALADIGTGEYVLAVDMHHIIADGISRDILTAELARLYRGETLAPHDIEFRDYCLWQRQMLDSGAWESQKKYWNDCFAGELPALNLATDLPRPATPQFQGKRLSYDMEPSHVAMVRRLMEVEDATLFMVFLSLLQVTLGKYSRQEDVVVGTAVAGRSLPQIAQSAGLFLETLALKGQPQGDKPFSAFLREVRRQTLDAFANQDYPFRELLRDLGAGVSLDRNPLFDVMLIVQNHQRLSLQLPDIAIETLEFDPGVAKLDITFEVFETAGEITVELEYDTQLYFQDTIERMWHHVLAVLEQAYADQEVRLENIGLLSDHERHEILVLFNGNDPETSTVDPVLRQLAVLAAAEPHRVAVCGPSTQLTYGELLRFARFLALRLQDRGVIQGDIVSVSVDRGAEMIVSLLAIWMAGGAYLPVDAKLPAERRRYLIDDSCANFAVCGGDNESFATKKIFVEEVIAEFLAVETDITAPETEQRVENHWPAYVIYTSGSTGRPKGVVVSHGNLAANMRAFLREFDISSGDVVVQQASVSFDTFGEEVYPLLLKGGRIVCPDADDVLDVGRLSSYIARHSATVLDCSPLLLNELNRRHSRELLCLRLIISGGDVLRKEFISGFLNDSVVYNTYGPTESTICATYHRCLAGDGPSIPIGTPIAGYKVYIMDPGLRLLPRGIPGELCVAGPGVTQGYLNNPELTAQRFIDLWGPNFVDLQAEDGDVLYRTGDLARWLPDGSLDYIGRIDQQIKIRGFRIELGEIEHHLLKHDAVKEACVLARQERQREKFLAAYVAFEPGVEAEEVNLRGYLAEELPDYMIPAYFITVEALPYTSSGKIDRRALPEPSAGDIVRSGSYVEPRTEQEKQLAAIWRDILAIDSIGVQDNFFELGGDSILANRVVVKIRDEMEADISLRDFFQHPTIASLGKRMPEKPRTVDRIPRVSRDRKIPLSFPQERLWFLHHLDGDNRSYYVPRALLLKGKVHVHLFERAFSEIIRRHEIFRTIFPTVDGEPEQQVQPPYQVKIDITDFSDLPSEEWMSRVREFVINAGQNKFSMNSLPMLRVDLIKLTDNEHVLVTTEHHLVHDGWTQGVLLNEFMALYEAYYRDEPSPLQEPQIQYADFAVWQRETVTGGRLEYHLDFWQRKLKGAQPLLDLPTDFPRPQIFSGKGELHRFAIPADIVSQLKGFCHEHQTTVFITMFAAFKLLLHHYSGCNDLCVGTAIANRSVREMDGMMGMVVNTMALRTVFPEEITFREFLQLIHDTCVEAYEHEETPFDKVVDRLSPKRSLSYSPVFQVMFSFMDTPTRSLELPELELTILNSHNRSSKFDISVVLILPRAGEDLAGEILVDWEYSTDLYTEESMARMGRHYVKLLTETLNRPDQLIHQFDYMSAAEKHRLLEEFNDSDREFDRNTSIIEPFIRQAEARPELPAVMCGHRALSYGELHQQSNRLAGYLNGRGIGAGHPVGVMMERSLEMVVALIAILKAGGFYLPIDTFYPVERKKFLIGDAHVRVCLTDGHDQDLDGIDVTVVTVEEGIRMGSPLAEAASPQGANLAYTIYTSGSTGVPKGVLVEHRQVNNCITWMQKLFPLTADDCVASRTNLTFDPSVWELFWPLAIGASVNVLSYIQSMDASFLLDVMAGEERGSIMYCPSSLLTAMTGVLKEKTSNGRDRRLSLRWLFIGAEPVRGDTIQEFYKHFDGRVVNTYGPTECTINNTYIVLEPGVERSFVPIGKPVANNRLYILGKHLQLLPRHVAGEICITGESLARGYLNSVEKTAQAFIPNPFGEGRLYRTGDLGRWTEDGDIEILGRIDKQLKIRGYRVEPDEIQNHLIDNFPVQEVFIAAEADEAGAKRLVAYLVAAAPQDRVELRRYLADKLPEYMVPSEFVQVEAIPLTSNGKVDVRELQKHARPAKEQTAPVERSSLEETIVRLWCRILNLDPAELHRDSNFFENGGHSLSVVRLASLLHQELNVIVPLSEIFLNPTIGSLEDFIKRQEVRQFSFIQCTEKREFYPATSPQRSLFFLQQLDPSGTAYNFPIFIQIKGKFDREQLNLALQRLVMRHESLRTYFVIKDGDPVQRILPAATCEIEYQELSGIDSNDFLSFETRRSLIKPFNLSEAPLLRVGLFRLNDTDHILMVDLHHIITDGASTNHLIADFITLYTGGELPELVLSYKDYSVWQHNNIRGNVLEDHLSFWEKKLSGSEPLLQIPTDFPRPPIFSGRGDMHWFKIPAGFVTRLKRLSAGHGTTLFITLLAVFKLLLHRYTDVNDLCVGTASANRHSEELDGIMGMFVNTIALRTQFSRGLPFAQFLKLVKETCIEAYQYSETPFDKVVQRLSPKRSLSYSPIFQAMFSFVYSPANSLELPGLDFSVMNTYNPSSKFDISVVLVLPRETDGPEQDIMVDWGYSVDLFKRESMERMSEHYLNLLDEVLECPGQSIYRFDFISDSEKRQMLHDFNDNDLDYDRDSSIIEPIINKVEVNKHRTAVTTGSFSLTYGELHRHSSRLAGYLKTKGAGPECPVAIMMERSVDLVVALLAILKAGGFYLPINTLLPVKRKQFLLVDSQAKICLIDDYDQRIDGVDVSMVTVVDGIQQGHSLELSEMDMPRGRSLAYALYTSGTTGVSKGVLVEHRQVNNCISWMQSRFPISMNDRIISRTDLTFDPSVWEIFWPLSFGASVNILTYLQSIDPDFLLELMAGEEKGGIMYCPSSLLTAMTGILKGKVRNGWKKRLSLRWLFIGAESVRADTIKQFYDHFDGLVVNTYGPTECTINNTYCVLEPGKKRSFVPIGKPVANNKLYILGKHLQLLPRHVVGEICISGESLSRGYLNCVEKTARSFIPNPFGEGRLYRTGDLGRWTEDGDIEILGRIDNQLKIRGYRVEPEEIRRHMTDIVPIRDVYIAAEADETGGKRLVAYLVTDVLQDRVELRRRLADKLPEYMIPSEFVQVEAIPLTVNGKVDERALQKQARPALEQTALNARSFLEEKIVDLWSRVLNLDPSELDRDSDFFENGGHSLSAVRLSSLLHQEMNVVVPLSEIFLNPTIASLEECIERKEIQRYTYIENVEDKEYYPTTSPQRRLFFLQQLEPSGTAYNFQIFTHIKGIFDRKQMDLVLQRLVTRHESLRTYFDIQDGEPVQRILAEADCEIEYKELSGIDLNEFLASEQCRSLIKPFNLSKAPLLRVVLFRLSETDHILMVDLHHIVTDGASTSLLIGDFFTLYAGGDLPELTLRYRDYTQWQHQTVRGELLEEHLSFWEKKLAGSKTLLEIPTDFPRPHIFSGKGDMHRFRIPADFVSQLKRFSKEHGATLFITLLAAFKLLLHRYTNDTDLCVGTASANRHSEELDRIMGMFVNTIALRTQFSHGLPFTQFMKLVKETCVEAYGYSETPFDKVVQRLSPKRSLSYSPIFQIMFSFVYSPGHELDLPGLDFSIMNTYNPSSKFDMSVVLVLPREDAGPERDILVDWGYSTDLFTTESMERMSGHFLKLLDEVLKFPGQSIDRFEFVSEAEKRKLLHEFNDNDLDYARDISTIYPMIKQMEINRSRLAVKSGERTLTYQELDIQSSRLAGYLKAKGVGPEHPVGITMERSTNLIVGLLAILKAGGFYLPIDNFYPAERKKFLLADARAKVCLIDDCDHGLDGLDVLMVNVAEGIERGDPCLLSGEDMPRGGSLAYVIYTSGSTGTPKGVLVEHRQVNNCISWMQSLFPLTADDRVVSRTNLTFDPSVWEIFWPLSTGASVDVLSYLQSMDAEFLIDLLSGTEPADIMYCPSSLLTAMVSMLNGKAQNGWDQTLSLRWLVIGAEPVRADTITDFYRFFDGRIVNTYGPTECTINNTFVILEPDDARSFVPIGKPVANNKLYILDKHLQLLPRNVAGEICIAGESLARGYLNSVEKTAQAFIPNPYGDGCLYRTGDLGRWMSDGNIEILGRIDKQLKIRGYRVEPEEIQNHLIKKFKIRDVFVTAETDEGGAKQLVAYLVADATQDRTEMRRYLSMKLPDYMVPSDFIQVDAIPLTPNGKVDTRALKKAVRGPVIKPSGPLSTLEEKMIDLWCRLLKLDPAELNQESNFFEIGGHSLNVIRLVSLIHQEMNVSISISDVFMNPTIGGLRDYIKQQERQEFIAIDPSEEKEYYPLTPPQRRLYFMQQLDPMGTAYNIPIFAHIKGPLDAGKARDAIHKLVMRHESLRSYFIIVNGEPAQRISAKPQVEVEVSEISGLDPNDFLSADIKQMFVKPFQLSEPPLLRAGLVKIGDGDHILMVDLHHIVTDGTSMNVLVRDFIALYTGGGLTELNLHYRDYAEWMNQDQSRSELSRQGEFWLQQFSGPVPPLYLPLDFERTAMKEFGGDTYSFEVSGKHAEGLNRLAIEESATLYILCLAVYYVLLFKLSGQEDIVVGTDTLGRSHADLNSMIGLFINTLALRNFPRADRSFRLFLGELKENMIKCFDNQDYPFDSLVEKVQVDRDLNRNPLFDVAFYFHNENEFSKENETITFGDLELRALPYRSETAKFDLMLSGYPLSDRFVFTFEYSNLLFKREKIEGFALMFGEIISAVCEDKNVRLGDIDVSLSLLTETGDEIGANDIEF